MWTGQKSGNILQSCTSSRMMYSLLTLTSDPTFRLAHSLCLIVNCAILCKSTAIIIVSLTKQDLLFRVHEINCKRSLDKYALTSLTTRVNSKCHFKEYPLLLVNASGCTLSLFIYLICLYYSNIQQLGHFVSHGCLSWSDCCFIVPWLYTECHCSHILIISVCVCVCVCVCVNHSFLMIIYRIFSGTQLLFPDNDMNKIR